MIQLGRSITWAFGPPIGMKLQPTCHSECYMGLRPTNGYESSAGPVIPSEATQTGTSVGVSLRFTQI
jgi:hypothetical protein